MAREMKLVLKSVVVCLCLVTITGLAEAIEIHVPGDYSSIQAGIDAASDGDTVLVSDGTRSAGNSGIDFKGKAITVKSENGPANCIIDCGNSVGTRGFYFHTGEGRDSILDGFTITNCDASIPEEEVFEFAGRGGGILCVNSSPTIMNCIIIENRTGYDAYSSAGGGVYCEGGSPKLINNVIAGNTAYAMNSNGVGGGIFCKDANIEMNNNSVIGNTAGHAAGGIWCSNGTITMTNNTIAENSLRHGDSDYVNTIMCSAGSVTMTGNIIENNVNAEIYFENEEAILINNTISGNVAGSDPLIFFTGGNVTLTSNAIIDNRYHDYLIEYQDTSVEMINNTIAGSPAASYNHEISCTGTTDLEIINTIIWSNIEDRHRPLYVHSSSSATVSHSDIQYGQTGVSGPGTINWGDGNIAVDPIFVDPDNGDYQLSDTSACIGTGTSDGAPENDIEGSPRGTPPDMGAYENTRDLPWRTVTITSPNSGEFWGGGGNQNITWSTEGPWTDHIRLLYSTDSGASYPNLITIIETGEDYWPDTYEWTLPSIDFSTVRVKIATENDVDAVMAEDESDADFTIDSTTPETNITNLDGTQGENGWYTSNVTVTLSASDSLSGVKETKYKINDGSWEIYSEPFVITGSTVYYQSEDNVDNLETEQNQEIKIDKTAPSIPAVTDDGDYTASTTQLHAWWTVSEDAESGVVEYQYAIGTTPGGTGTQDWTSSGLNTDITAEGLSLTGWQTYYFSVQAKNEAGLWSDSGVSDGIIVNEPPVVELPDSVSFGEDLADSSIDLDDYVDDPDNTDSEMDWAYSGNSNIYVDISPTTNIVTFTALENWFGSEVITFTAADPGEASDDDSVTVTVESINDAPEVSSLGLEPSFPADSDDLQGSYIYTDLEGDVESGSEIRWYKNEVLQPMDTLTVTSGDTDPGDTWYYTVTPKDGMDLGVLQTSPSVRIGMLLASIPAASGFPGATITIPVEIEDTTGYNIISVELTVTYDPDILTMTDMTTAGTIAQSWGDPVYNIIPGQAIIGMIGVTPLSGAGLMLNLTFNVSPDAAVGSSSVIALVDGSLNEGNVAIGLHDGSFITIDSGAYGDVSGNGNVSSYDAALTLQNVVELIDFTPQQEVLADVSGSSGVSAYDSALILQYAVGLIDTFPVEGSGVESSITAASLPVEVNCPDIIGEAGSDVIIPISVSDTTDAGIIGIDLTVSYDPDILTVIDVTIDGTIASGWNMNYNIANGQAIIGIMNASALSGAGELVKIVFRVSEAAVAGDNSPLTLSNASFNEGTVPAIRGNGLLVVGGQEPMQILHFYPGWNFFSICLDIADTDLLSVLADIDGYYTAVWSYKGDSKSWEKYTITAPEFLNNLYTIEYGNGYWIEITDEVVLVITGDEIIDTGILLYEDWNMVGWNCRTSQSRTEALESVDYSALWTYDNQEKIWLRFVEGSPDFLNTLDQFDEGNAYWIDVETGTTWTISP